MVEKQSNYRLLHNVRFYVLASSVLASIAVVAWLRIQIPSDQLFYIRTQQVFGLLCVVYWYTALIISPLGYAIGKQRISHLVFARRAIGVSAAYFAVLHGAVALWGQLGGPGQLVYLPSLFKWSLLGGAIALIILLAMALTSFDRVIKFMTFRRWKWLHRLVYMGGILAVLHIWAIGTHLAYIELQLASLLALVLLGGLEIYRTVVLFARKHEEFQHKDYFFTLYISLATIWVLLVVSVPVLLQNYHSRHNDHENSSHGREHQ
jgi:DMSO/TMAO reductase YedYZ heme-binding membrane subunit